jgi:RNA polymerase sigma-70 factor, ECF subfamily
MPDSRSDRFSRLFVESGTALKRYVLRLVRSRETADEIVQEAFLRAYQHADEERPPGALLYSIARNLAMDHHRHGRSAQTQTLGDIRPSTVLVEGAGESLESWLLAEEQSSLLKDAIEQLSPQCRAAFGLKVFHCCSYREIAQKLGISEKTVEVHISRGMRETYRYLRQRYQLKDVSSNHD